MKIVDAEGIDKPKKVMVRLGVYGVVGIFHTSVRRVEKAMFKLEVEIDVSGGRGVLA